MKNKIDIVIENQIRRELQRLEEEATILLNMGFSINELYIIESVDGRFPKQVVPNDNNRSL